MGTPTMQELVLTEADVAQRRSAHGREEAPGVLRTVLWEHTGSAAGVLSLDPGAELAEHTHASHGHHVWVVKGTARVLGRDLSPGAYWFVPPGRAHSLVAGDEPCELFYVYEQDGD